MRFNLARPLANTLNICARVCGILFFTVILKMGQAVSVLRVDSLIRRYAEKKPLLLENDTLQAEEGDTQERQAILSKPVRARPA